MAFLCPVRIRRGKKKKSTTDVDKELSRSGGGTPLGMGRITGSASIETLVRVGIEKENGLSPDSKMVVLHDFTPCVDDELEVKRGQVVNVLYRENDWVYVIAADTRQEGFIPHSYCTLYNSHLGELALNNVKKKLPRDERSDTGGPTVLEGEQDDQRVGAGGKLKPGIRIHIRATGHATVFSWPVAETSRQIPDVSDCESFGKKNTTGATTSALQLNMTSSQASLHSASSSQPEVHPFFKDPAGRYIVLYTFIARDENDVSVERGEFVTVLNREDPDWYWIVRSDGQEGFVPSGFVYPADVIKGHLNQGNQQHANNYQTHHHAVLPANEDLRYHGTELVMLYDYKAQAPDDLSVRRGDWIYADLGNQTVDGWLWAYAPKTRKYGFIPKAYARPPAMTSL